MKKIIWKLLLGAVVTGIGGVLAVQELGSTTPTVATVLGIALLAVGVSILSGIFGD